MTDTDTDTDTDTLTYELERLYQRYHPDSDPAEFVTASLELLDMLKFIEAKPSRGDRSSAECKRISLLNTLRNLEGTLLDHIDSRLWDLFGPPDEGRPVPLSQIILALDAPIPEDEDRLIARKASDVPGHLAAVRLLWHTGYWGLSYPEGYLYLAEVMRPHADSVVGEAAMARHGDKYSGTTIEAAISARNEKEGLVNEVKE